MKLSKEDARAIRRGRDFFFRVDRAGSELHIYDKVLDRESEYIIRDRERSYEGLIFFSAFDTHSGYSALKALVRAGDELIWEWMDNSNGYVKAAEISPQRWKAIGDDDGGHHPHYFGLHNDSLYVTIRRNGKSVVTQLLIDQSVCVDNSARAIRKGAF